jgi:secreted trypsin-like serine protease
MAEAKVTYDCNDHQPQSVFSSDTCQGDSGGPLMYYSEKREQWMIAGITSYGVGCGLPDYAGVYTRAAMYVDWIKSVVGNDGVVIAGENSAQLANLSYRLLLLTFIFMIFMQVHQ